MSNINLRDYVLAVRSRRQPGTVKGTAFLASLKDNGYAVTCHHVVEGLTDLELYFTRTKESVRAQYVPEYSRPELDVAVLKLIGPRPDELQILNLSLGEVQSGEFRSFGFPMRFSGLWASGGIEGLIPPPRGVLERIQSDVVQLRTSSVVGGMSGAPVVLVGSATVVGMIVGGHRARHGNLPALGYAVPIEAIREAYRDLLPESPFQTRDQWIASLQFKLDPFLYTDGGNDPHLAKYFYPVPNFLDILGDASRPETVLVFGAEGSGKSSLRNAIAQICREEGSLPIVYRDFRPVVRKAKGSTGIRVEDHVDRILEAAIDALYLETQEKRLEQLEFQDAELVRRCLSSYVTRYSRDPVRRQRLRRVLNLRVDECEPLPQDFRDLLARFCRYMTQLFGFRCVYLLVDPEEDVSSETSVAWHVLKPLLSEYRLLDLAADGAAFRFFLSDRFLPLSRQIPWVSEQRGGKIHLPLEWSEEGLRALLKERLRQCSNKFPPSVSLGELSDMDNLDDIVIKRSGGSPRRLIRLCDWLFRVHCQAPITRDRLLITEEEVFEALRQMDPVEPAPMAERVLIGDEGLDVFTVSELIAHGEGSMVEFKSTLRYNLRKREKDLGLEREIARTLCGFMNADGGVLLIGVADSGSILGLDHDFSVLGSCKNKKDAFELALNDVVANLLLLTRRQNVKSVDFVPYNDRLICVVQVEPSLEPVYCLFGQRHELYVRVGNVTKRLDAKDAVEYVQEHFAGSQA